MDLHWRVAAHENIVNLIDIYENVYMGQRSLLVVMEWLALYVQYIPNSENINKGHLGDRHTVNRKLLFIMRHPFFRRVHFGAL